MAKSKYELASLGSRLLSAIIDGFILGIVTGILFGAGREAGGGISFVVGLVYYWYFWTRQNGQTLGKRVMNLKVVKEDGGALNDTDAIMRYIGYIINSAVFLLGWIWVFVDKDRQGWHDKIAKTYVVQA
jgi:uncharacterized RDD family membrane protein YckC